MAFSEKAFKEDQAGGNSEIWRPKAAKTLLRLLPGPEGRELPWVTSWRHQNLPINPNFRGVVCSKKTEGYCPVCLYVSELYNQNKNAEASPMKSKPFHYANVVIMMEDGKKLSPEEYQVVIYRFGKMEMDDERGLRRQFYKSPVVSADVDDIEPGKTEVDDGLVDISDVVKGYNLLLVKEKTGASPRDVKYYFQRSKEPRPLADAKRLLAERMDIMRYMQEKPDMELLTRNTQILQGTPVVKPGDNELPSAAGAGKFKAPVDQVETGVFDDDDIPF